MVPKPSSGNSRQLNIRLEHPVHCYKLRIMGIPLDGKTSVFCDSEGVVKNTMAPESPLKKRHVAICYHRCREALAADFIQLAKEDTKTNLADAFMKPSPGPRWKELLSRILY
jgi:hypothetical protein